MSTKIDPLDTAVRIDDVSEDRSLDGVVRKAGGRIRADDLDENVTIDDEVARGLQLADDEFDGITVGGLLGTDIDPDLVQFDDDGNIIKKKPKDDSKKKKKNGDDEFADDEDDDVVLELGDDQEDDYK